MPQNLTLNKISDAAVYVDGEGFKGKVRTVNLPQAALEMVEMNGLGLYGNPEVPVGLQAMEATLEWDSIYESALSKVFNFQRIIPFQIRKPRQFWSSSEGQTSTDAVVCTMRASPKQLPFGSQSNNEKVSDLETTLAVHYLKYEVGGTEIAEIDPWGNRFVIRGEDLLAQYRGAMGE